jgi:alkylhydroperoxidase family enzyme
MISEPRLARIDPAQAPEVLRPTFDAFVRDRGKVPNLFQIAGHAPRVAASMASHLGVVMGAGEVPVLLKELLSVRVSQINLCDY